METRVKPKDVVWLELSFVWSRCEKCGYVIGMNPDFPLCCYGPTKFPDPTLLGGPNSAQKAGPRQLSLLA